MYKKLLLAAALLCTPLAQAEQLPDFDASEPQITIRHDEGKTFYEYRINGELREIKVVPSRGKPYYLVPADSRDGFIRVEESQLLIPKWILFRW
ncbi:DUF2782 domain-containing protein [Marinobacterium arenosum]|uniref:DUF2782 domain-containing protein n=1 Tax=Marinobacterium arenosum TaxID=2862496 RepID=UPI001C98D670|nr:DUF2782 domain-containing protein [Marinobacterium arenosum]MBY4678686.1 DUF2782 domain-containing protein [Marinobacterium arenosum]